MLWARSTDALGILPPWCRDVNLYDGGIFMKNKDLSLRITVLLSLLAALSIVLGKYLAIPVGEVLRFSFENLPLILAGIGFGPLGGALVGAVADLVGCALVGYTVNPLVTLGAMTVGAISGAVWMIIGSRSLPLPLKVGTTVAAAHIIGSVVIKTVGLATYYSMPLGILMLWRLLNYVIVGCLEGIVICLLLRNKEIHRELEKYRIKKKNPKENEEDENHDVR
jgi:ECF transporter S component (folate family)